jgi:hypothetical protein
MADSAVPITGGSGYNVDTRTESTNSNHRQVIVIGDPSTNGGIAPVDATNGLSVTLTTALVAGTAAIGKLAANDGVDIGDVTINNAVGAGVYIRPGTGVNLDTANVTVATSALPSGAATAAHQVTQNTSLSDITTSVQLIDDAVYTDGTGTPSKALAVAGTDGTNPQIVSVTSAGAVNIADGGNTITVDGTVAATQSGTWNITNVSGTVSLPTGASTSAKQDTIITSVQLIDDAIYADATGTPDKGIAIMGTDGTNPQLVSVTSAGLLNIADGGGNISIDDGGNTITVDGTITANLGTIGGAATAAKQPALGTAGTASTDVITVQGIASMTALKVDGSGVTQPVSGTITANAGTGFPALITDGSAAGTAGIHILGTDGTNGQILSTDTSGQLKVVNVAADAVMGRVKLTDGTDVADILDLTNSNPLTVAIVDATGDQIVSFGGGTQYTEGDIDASITGTALLWEDTSNTLRAASAAKPFPVEIIAGAGSGGTASADDADFTAGTTNGTPAMGVYESTPTSVTDGDLGTVGITVGRRMKTSATIDAALPAGTNAIGKLAANDGVDIGDVTINNATVAVTQSGTWTVQPGNTANTTPWLASIHDGTTKASVLDLTNNNPLTVAIVDTSGDQISSFGGGTQYTEDAASAANPVGTALMLVREDGRAGSLTTTDGDNVAARGNNKGELYVKTTDSDALLTTIDADTGNISTKIDTIAGAVSGTEVQVDVLTMPTVTVNSHAVTNAGTFAVQVDGAALTSLQLADDVVATLGTTTYTEAATKGTTIGAVRRDADTTLVDTTNEIGPLQMDANGRLKVEVFSGETLPVSGTVSAAQSGSWEITTYPQQYNGSTFESMVGTGANGLDVDVTRVQGTVAVTQSGTWDEVGINDSGNSITVDNGGTFAVQAAQSGTWSVRPDSYATDDTAMPATPLVVPVAGEYRNAATTYTDGDATVLQTDVNGYLKVNVATGGTSGVQYTEGDVDASITGTAILWENTSDTLAAVNETTPLPTRQYVSGGLLVGSNPNDDTQATSGLSLRNIGFNYAFNGTDWVRVRGDVSNGLDVDVTRVGGTVAVTQSGTWDEVGINDSGNSITVDNGGTFAVQVDGSALTALQLIDDTVATLGTSTYSEATTKGTVIGAVRRDADTTLVDTTNEIGPLQMNAAGQLKVEVFSGETLPVSLTSTTVTGTVAVTQSGTWDEVGINDSGNSITVDNGGTFAVQAAQSGTWTLGANSGVDIGDVTLNNLTTTPVFTQHNITGLGHGVTTVTTAGTDVALAASTACKRVIIQAQTDNTTGVAVGGTGVDATVATGTGVFLYPGDSIELETDNLADIFIDALTNGEGVRYTYFT